MAAVDKNEKICWLFRSSISLNHSQAMFPVWLDFDRNVVR